MLFDLRRPIACGVILFCPRSSFFLLCRLAKAVAPATPAAPIANNVPGPGMLKSKKEIKIMMHVFHNETYLLFMLQGFIHYWDYAKHKQWDVIL